MGFKCLAALLKVNQFHFWYTVFRAVLESTQYANGQYDAIRKYVRRYHILLLKYAIFIKKHNKRDISSKKALNYSLRVRFIRALFLMTMPMTIGLFEIQGLRPIIQTYKHHTILVTYYE